MSAPEQVSKVATSAIDALRGNPGLLVLVILQMATLAVAFYAVEQQRERQFKREMMLLEHCLPGENKATLRLMDKTSSIPPRDKPDKVTKEK